MLCIFCKLLATFADIDQANTRRRPNVALMLGQRLRRWPNIKQTMVQRRESVGYEVVSESGQAPTYISTSSSISCQSVSVPLMYRFFMQPLNLSLVGADVCGNAQPKFREIYRTLSFT